MASVWETVQIGNMTLNNRFVRSATVEGLALNSGYCRPKINQFYKQLGNGKTGLLISGHMFVDPIGQAGSSQVGIQNNAMIDGISQIAKSVHETGSKILAQLSHAGAHAATWATNLPAKGPSAMDFGKRGRCEAMTFEDIHQLILRFVDAAKRAKTAGFDGIQIHAAHGYCLSQFLSPWYNHREDEYGGSLINRARLLLEIIEAIQAELGHDFPLVVKLNSEDFLEGGLTVDEMLEVAQMLEEKNIQAVELSGGCSTSPKFETPVRPLDVDPEDITGVYYLKAAKRFKQTVKKTPLMLVGGIKSLEIAQQLVEENVADFIALSRPLICEPNLIDRWSGTNTSPSVCIRCSKCFQTLASGEGVSCAIQQALFS